jgi:hypothetical protein
MYRINRLTPLALIALLVACAPPLADDLASVDVATYPIVDGLPDAVGLLDLLNDPTTTLEVLDDEVPLNSRTASNLIAARQAFGGFDSVAEVDAVYWVGPSAINKLVEFAGEQGRIPGDNDLLGTWDGVSFTVAQAELTLEIVVNDLEHHDFDIYMGLDRRAADSIVAAQPVESIAVLAGLYYVGNSALEKIKNEAMEMLGEDDWPGCVPTFTAVTNQASLDLSELLALSTTVDNPFAEATAFQSSGCGDWWTDAGSVEEAMIGLWDETFFLSWSQLSDDYRLVGPWTAGGSDYTAMLDLSLQVIEENIDDDDFDPSASPTSQALYDARFDLVDELSVDLATNPGAYLQQTYEFEMVECSEEAVMLLDTRDGSVLVIHQLQNC